MSEPLSDTTANHAPEALPGPIAQVLSSIVIVGLRRGGTDLLEMIENYEDEMQSLPDVTAALEAGESPPADELDEGVVPATEEDIQEVLATLARVSTTDPDMYYQLAGMPDREAAARMVEALETMTGRA